MQNETPMREGMRVIAADGRELGTLERHDGDDLHVAGLHFPRESVARVDRDAVQLLHEAAQYTPERYGGRAREVNADTAGEVRVPELEERLRVDAREAQMGEVRIEKHVEERQQTIPVELEREEVHVERRDVAERPVAAGERVEAFKDETISVPVHAEEAVVSKEAVTGEVVVDKERTTEREEVSGTLRRTHVHVDKDLDQ